jgi:preprotein translocase subunit YajC
LDPSQRYGPLFERVEFRNESLLDFSDLPAHAQGLRRAGRQPVLAIIMLVVFFAVLYFVALRPQMKRAKEQCASSGALAKGDEVLARGRPDGPRDRDRRAVRRARVGGVSSSKSRSGRHGGPAKGSLKAA